MARIHHPFDTLLAENRDFNEGDLQAEIDALFIRQQAIAQFCAGELSADDLLELLADQLIDPAQYVDEVEENIEILIARD